MLICPPVARTMYFQKRTKRLKLVVVRSFSASVSAASEAGQLEHSQTLESFFDDTGEFFETKNEQPEWIKKVVAAGLVEKGKYITGTTLEEFRGEHCGGTLVFTRVGKRQGS